MINKTQTIVEIINKQTQLKKLQREQDELRSLLETDLANALKRLVKIVGDDVELANEIHPNLGQVVVNWHWLDSYSWVFLSFDTIEIIATIEDQRDVVFNFPTKYLLDPIELDNLGIQVHNRREDRQAKIFAANLAETERLRQRRFKLYLELQKEFGY